MKKIVLILSSWFIAGSAGAYIDYTGKYRPVLELSKALKKNKFKITQHKNSLYNEVYNITVPSSFYLPEYSSSDQSVCEQASAKQDDSKYPKKCLSGHSFSLSINVLSAKGKTNKYKKSPEVAPVASIDLVAYDSKEAISLNNVGYPTTNTVIMGKGEASSWDVILRKNYKNYYCIWAKITLPTKTSQMAHMSELLVDFQKQVSDGNITLPKDFTSILDYDSWLGALGDSNSPRKIMTTEKVTACTLDAAARTKDYYTGNYSRQCKFSVGSKLRRQFIIEDFLARKDFGHNRQYFKDDQVAPIYLRIVREDNLVCRINPWINLRGNNANLRDFPLETNL
ncbi:MAG: hypothetical protein OXM55_04675 [Bdellovibrionales bacterium]|nr:hypothetical protein [Bdellovibrionales bacterium]